jgi:hypothetical protein
MSNEQTPKSQLQHTLVELMCGSGVAKRNPLDSFSEDELLAMRLTLLDETETDAKRNSFVMETVALASRDNPGLFKDKAAGKSAYLDATDKILVNDDATRTGERPETIDENEDRDAENLSRLTVRSIFEQGWRSLRTSLAGRTTADLTARFSSYRSSSANEGDEIV